MTEGKYPKQARDYAKQKLGKRTCGQPCEVFSRVCGYHRPVKNWNVGKRREFKGRKVFKVEKGIKKNEDI